jgi:hypothetical protein
MVLKQWGCRNRNRGFKLPICYNAIQPKCNGNRSISTIGEWNCFLAVWRKRLVGCGFFGFYIALHF